jgi:DNA-binding HxlR family transcriptional regulator
METNSPNVYSETCPTRAILNRIADKWTTLIIGILSTAGVPVRFGEIRRQIDGISQKMLTQTLRDLERDGLVVRTVYPEIPPRVDYALTPLGHTLEVPLNALAIWAHQHMTAIGEAQAVYDARAGNRAFSR